MNNNYVNVTAYEMTKINKKSNDTRISKKKTSIVFENCFSKKSSKQWTQPN